jgi:uncharacterized protein (TIGR02284 family)
MSTSLALNRSHIAAALDRLARLNREAEARFRHAAERAAVDALRDVLGRWGRERARFAHELEIETQALGDRATTIGSSTRLRSAASTGDLQRIEICRTAEQAALQEYESALLQTLPVDIERLLRAQHSAIKDAFGRLAQMAQGIV